MTIKRAKEIAGDTFGLVVILVIVYHVVGVVGWGVLY